MLKKLEMEEEERIRLKRLEQERNQLMEHFADGEIDINLFSDVEIDKKCDELFADASPIPFVPKKGANYKLE